MKFKENAIKPGMVIHCPKEEDARVLSEYLIKLGVVNANRIMEYYGSDNGVGKIDTVLITRREGNLYAEYSDRRWFEKDEYHMKITEFSDLIEPDNSKETVKPIINKACLELWQEEGEEETVHYLFHGSEELLQEYLAENSTGGEKSTEMTAAEVLEWLMTKPNETLDYVLGYNSLDEIFRNKNANEIIDIITAYEAAKKKPVEVEWVDVVRIAKHEEDSWHYVHEEIIYPKDHTAEDVAGTILKEYVSKHDGIYHAFADRICRIKED